MRSVRSSRVAQAVAAAVACAAVVALGYALGAFISDGGSETRAGARVDFETIAPASLARAGLVFITPTRAQARAVPVTRETAIAAARAHSAGFNLVEAHLAYWLENAGSDIEDDHLVWLVVEESPYGYYVSGGPPSTKENTAYIAFIDPVTGEWQGAESFGR